jgi:alpha-ketoglutarate-dependent 2,4-dichlorophenoxyacetate dioxygenase
MSLSFTPLHPVFGAEVSGVDMRGRVAPTVAREIDAAMDRYAVLLFRGQAMDQSQQVAMAESFGTLDPGLKKLTRAPERMEHEVLIDISNLGMDGRPVARDDRKLITGLANQLWHSDSSFQRNMAQYSMLSAVQLPSWGGQTEFCDLRVAWEALDARTRADVAGLKAEHWALHSRFMLGDDAYTAEQQARMPPVVWPLLRRQQATGRDALFIGAHARRIPGMNVAEGRLLLAELLEHATHPSRIWHHEWRLGDLVMWDNRTTLHRGRRYDLSEPRELRRTTTMDYAISAEAAA